METTQTKLQKERAKRKLRKQKKQEAKALQIVKKEQKEQEEKEVKTEPEVEVEYVVVNPFEIEDNVNEEYQEFKEIFNHFLKVEDDDKKKDDMPEQGVTDGKTADAPVKEEKLSKKKRKLQRRFALVFI